MPGMLKQISITVVISLCALFTVTPSFGQPPDKDLLELQHYTLTMPNVTRFWETFGSLAKMAKDHPEFKDALETDADKHEDLAAVEKRTASVPLVKSAIIDHGLTVHEFVLIQLSLFQSALAAALAPPGPDRAKKAIEAGVNPANLEFIDKHKSEIEALQAKNAPQDASGN